MFGVFGMVAECTTKGTNMLRGEVNFLFPIVLHADAPFKVILSIHFLPRTNTEK